MPTTLNRRNYPIHQNAKDNRLKPDRWTQYNTTWWLETVAMVSRGYEARWKKLGMRVRKGTFDRDVLYRWMLKSGHVSATLIPIYKTIIQSQDSSVAESVDASTLSQIPSLPDQHRTQNGSE